MGMRKHISRSTGLTEEEIAIDPIYRSVIDYINKNAASILLTGIALGIGSISAKQQLHDLKKTSKAHVAATTEFVKRLKE